MTLINDIFLNMHEDYYEFFEWNKKDVIIHLKKVPIIKTTTDNLKKIINSKINLDDIFLNKYQKKAEYYGGRKKDNIVIFCDGKLTCALKFSDDGKIIKKSSLIFEDEDNACNSVKNLHYEDINFKFKEIKNDINLTRFEKDKKKFLLKNIVDINQDRLDYLYYDCFLKYAKKHTNIIKIISDEIINNNFDVWDKCYNFINLIYERNK